MAESAIKTAKRILRKCKVAKQDPHLSILNYRNTPSAGLDVSPIQRFIDRRTRILLPPVSKLLEPTAKTLKEERKKLMKKRRKNKLTSITNTQRIYLVSMKEMWFAWKHTCWMIKCGRKPLWSYEISPEYGNICRRNRAHLKESNELSQFEYNTRQLEEAKSDGEKTVCQEIMIKPIIPKLCQLIILG